MKAILLLLVSIVSVAARKKTHFPLTFFAKVNGSLVPLSGKPLGDQLGHLNSFSYGDTTAKPVEFTLQKNHAFTINSDKQEYVGFDRPFFFFGPSVHPSILKLDATGKVFDGAFYSCKMVNSRAHSILYRPKIAHDKLCFQVDIYLLPYHRIKGTSATDLSLQNDSVHEPVKGKRIPATFCNMSSDVPMGFFAKVNNKMVPLSGQVFKIFSLGNSVFTYGVSAGPPVQFTVQNGYAMTKDAATPGYAGFRRGLFVYGLRNPKTQIKLTRKMKVQNTQFYSCRNSFNPNRVIGSKRTQHCFAVGIYLLPYEEYNTTLFKAVSEPSSEV